jgi:alkylhydroperoxidase/carboxymuconolactone decarboxylase family protein YurZ
MPLKMTRELGRVLDTCTEETLSVKDTYLVTLAAQLALGGTTPLSGSLKLGEVTGATQEEIQRVACMCACTVGPQVNERVAELSVNQLSEPVRACTEESLDQKTTHLVGLAACLVAGCACAEFHIVEGRNAGATEEELARCACIAACVAGRVQQFRFLEARQNVEGRADWLG